MKTNTAALAPQLLSEPNFRLYLQAELASRCLSNQQYSLRSFAVFLGIDHSTLSQLIRGKRALTEKTIVKLSERLGLNRGEIEAFVLQEKCSSVGDTSASREIRQLMMDTAGVLSDSTHRSILELTRLDGFLADSRWIARVLNLSVDEVNVAVTRLIRLGLIEMTRHNRWLDKSGETASNSNDFAHLAIQRLSEKVRGLSANAVKEAHESSSTKLVIKSEQLSLVKEFMERLRPAGDVNPAEGDYELQVVLRPICKTD